MPTPTAHPTHCRYCGATLSALLRLRGDVCAAPACRLEAGKAQIDSQRQSAVAGSREQAARQCADPRALRAPVYWLNHHETVMVPLADEERETMAAHLRDVVAGEPLKVRMPTPAPEWDPAPAPATDGVVCGFCRGYCCHEGAYSHAFIEQVQLERWCQRHGGSLEDAAAHFLAALPPQHAQNSCLFNGHVGCVLKREDRAAICNGYACSTLQQAREQVERSAPDGVLLASQTQGRLVATAWLTARDGQPQAETVQAEPEAAADAKT